MASSSSSAAAGRYAKALFLLAEKAGALEGVTKDMESLSRLMQSEADFRRVVMSPLLSRAKKQQAVLAIADHAGVVPLTRQFLQRLSANGRLALVPAVAQGLRQQWHEKQHIAHVHVASADALTATQIAGLTRTLEAATGKKITLETSVDPRLLGGVTVRLGSVLVDASLGTHLAQLKRNLKQAIAA